MPSNIVKSICIEHCWTWTREFVSSLTKPRANTCFLSGFSYASPAVRKRSACCTTGWPCARTPPAVKDGHDPAVHQSKDKDGQGKFNLCVWLSMRILIQSISFFSHESSWAGMASCRKFLAFESSWPFQLLCCRNPYLCYLKVYVAYCSPRALSDDWNLQSSIPWRCNMLSYATTRFVMLYLNPKEHVHEPPRAT